MPKIALPYYRQIIVKNILGTNKYENAFGADYAKVYMQKYLTNKEKLFKNYKMYPYMFNKYDNIYPNAINLYIASYDKNHLYYTLSNINKKFPKLENLFIATHVCEPKADYIFNYKDYGKYVFDPKKKEF